MKFLSIGIVGLLAVWMTGCKGARGDCEYVEAMLPAIVTQSFDISVILKLERDDRLVTLRRDKVEGEARVGSRYIVRVRDLIEGSCTPVVAVDAKPR